jgi:TatD DNase family protein
MIDIGLNLTNSRFDGDRDEVLAQALAAGVRGAIITGTSLASSQAGAAYCREYRGAFQLWCTAGIHPHEASSCTSHAMAELELLIQQNPGRVVAIGETGLDFNRNFSPPEAQIKAFEQQIELAQRHRLPLFLHERDAHRQQLDILKGCGELPPTVIHCFTGNREALDNYLALGCYIGITGWLCDERRGQELQQQVADVPLDKLLVETDAPYLLPRTLKPRPKNNRNEPAYLAEVVAMLARCRQQSVGEIAAASFANTRRLFRLNESQ